MTIFVSGSMAYDRIMTFTGSFSDQIIDNEINDINLSFAVDGIIQRTGGTAGNIAYALSLFGKKPVILATLGDDHQSYLERLNTIGLPISAIRLIPGFPTASAYIATDLKQNQITMFNPGAMQFPCKFEFDKPELDNSIAIISPGNITDMIRLAKRCKENSIPYIFDPGQSLSGWQALDLSNCIDGALLLISNKYEMELIKKITGLTYPGILDLTNTIITTLGHEGSTIITATSEIFVPICPPKQIIDPTGAGDAYRGGLIKGIIDGLPLDQSARIGAACASFAVEYPGTQEYSFSESQFEKRLSLID